MLNDFKSWWSSELIEGKVVTYQVDVDLRRMRQLVGKACLNKRQRTKVGPLVLRIVKKEEGARG